LPFLKKTDPHGPKHAPKHAPGKTGARQLITAILMGVLLAFGFIGAAALADADGNLAPIEKPQAVLISPHPTQAADQTPGL